MTGFFLSASNDVQLIKADISSDAAMKSIMIQINLYDWSACSVVVLYSHHGLLIAYIFP